MKRPHSAWRRNIAHVPCRGPRGVFSAFAAFFPDLARVHGTSPKNMNGVADIELNKFMQVNNPSVLRKYICQYARSKRSNFCDLDMKTEKMITQAAGFTTVRKQGRKNEVIRKRTKVILWAYRVEELFTPATLRSFTI
jgi:hypothetical protein